MKWILFWMLLGMRSAYVLGDIDGGMADFVALWVSIAMCVASVLINLHEELRLARLRGRAEEAGQTLVFFAKRGGS